MGTTVRWGTLPVMLRIVLLTAGITALLAFFAMGWALDRAVEQQTDLFNSPFDESGVARDAGAIEVVHQRDRAVLLSHGMGMSPLVLSDVANAIARSDAVDVYVPLLPFHGRRLADLAEPDTAVMRAYLESRIAELANRYERLTVVGYSLSGAFLIDLAAGRRLPDNIDVVLSSPAVHIASNTPLSRIQASALSVWRRYCNYAFLGCVYAGTGSSDTRGEARAMEVDILRTYVVPLLSAVWANDLAVRGKMPEIKRPVHVIMARNDNMVRYDRIGPICAQMPDCTMHAFPAGSHLLEISARYPATARLITEIARTGTARCFPGECETIPSHAEQGQTD